MIVSKTPVEAGQPSQAVYRKFDKPPTESFRLWEEERVIQDFKESVVELWPGPGRLSDNAPTAGDNQPLKSYEMPDGWNNLFNIQDRRRIAEGLFDEKAAFSVSVCAKILAMRLFTFCRTPIIPCQRQIRLFQRLSKHR
jgi:actin-related protein 4